MPGRELPATITPATALQAWEAMGAAWTSATGHAPSRATLACLVAQWALETGWGKQMRCFNIGNVKATPKWEGDFAYFATSERLSPEQAAHAVANASPRRDGQGPNVEAGTEPDERGRLLVRFAPSHPATKFRAFASLKEGAAQQVRVLRTSFPTTIDDLEAGNPDAWARALYRAHYYTANPDAYADTMTRIFGDIMGRGYPDPSGAQPPAPPAPPVSFGPGPGDALMGLVGAALVVSVLLGVFR